MRRRPREIEFNVDAYTARLIGRENVSKLEGAIFELVKNAYDADATMVCLYYSRAADSFFIMDNGCGMKEKILIDHWMTIGNSSKKDTYMSAKGRVQTGAKGIGRFALDRLSDCCHMLTVSEDGGLEWIVNWNDFEGHKRISDVKAKLYDSDQHLDEYVNITNWYNKDVTREIRKYDLKQTGTVFTLTNLHDSWNEGTMVKIKNHLENLLPPDVNNKFQIWFFDDETTVEEAKLKSANIETFDYRIGFNVQNDTLNIQIKRNEFDFRGEDETVFSACGFDEEQQKYFKGKEIKLCYKIHELLGKENCIGDFSGILYFNKIQQTKGDQEKFYYKDITGRENLVKKFGGVKVYRDQFRVRPYGEYGDNAFDWLELSARKNRSPAAISHKTGSWRVASEQMLGSVFISRENKNLEDDANRNAIQEGEGLIQLRKILVMVITEFERDRQFVGRKLARYNADKNKLQAQIEEMRRMAELRNKWEKEFSDKNREQEQKGEVPRFPAEDDERTFDESDMEEPTVNPQEAISVIDALGKEQEQQLQDLRDEIKMLQTLATTGIITNMFMHEIRTSTNNIGIELDSAFDAIEYDQDMEYARENILNAIGVKKNFASWFGITIESIRKDKRRRKKHNIAQMLKSYIGTWNSILAKSDTKLIYRCDEGIELYCFEFDIENIISNLFANSLACFDREMNSVLEKREIYLNISSNERGFLIDYSDSGWGLIPKYKQRPELILEPFESGQTLETDEDTSEEEGTGMGMWIVNKTVIEYNGKVDLSENKVQENGFYIKIQIGGNNV